MKKKIIKIVSFFFLICLLVAVGYIFTINAHPFALSKGGKITIRQSLLSRWYNEVNAYIEIENRTPDSLYEICQRWIANDSYMNVPDELYLGLGRGFAKDEKEKIKQEDFFLKQVRFQLIKSKNSDFWIIREINRENTHQMFINNSGEIYNLDYIKTVPDLSHLYH